MDSFNDFLNKNQPASNKNQKFVDSSPTSSVFARLGYDFTPSNPEILLLSPAALKHLNSMPKFLQDWQAEDMRNGVVNNNNYFKNPLQNITITIINNLEAIRNVIPTRVVQPDPEFGYGRFGATGQLEAYTVVEIPALEPIYESSNVAIAEARNFIDHTNRLSNTVEFKPEAAELPHFDAAMAVGKQLLYVVNQTDGIENTSPILGTFTSLFVESEMTDYNNLIAPYSALIANSITVTTTFEGGMDGGYVTTKTSNLASSIITTMTDTVNSLKVFIERRRKHDENFWKKAQLIVEEYNKLKRTNTAGETQDKLIDGYIGSDSLKAKRLIKDVPASPRYNVDVSYNGTITYNSLTPNVASYVIPTIEVRTTPTTSTITYVSELPLPGEVVGDEYYVTTTGETWRWNGTTWILISQVDPNSPIITLEDYINFYSNNTLHLTFNGYELDLTPGALIFNTVNGVLATNASITITNTSDKAYIFSDVITTNFLDVDMQYSFSNVTSNTIPVGNSATFVVSLKSMSEANTVDYGVITIVPGIDIQTKLISNTASHGILLPSQITQNVGSPTTRLPINVAIGPYPLLDANSSSPNLWTWRNDSIDPVTISSITNITEANSTDDMTITFYQATTPNTINVNGSVLWYANVNAHVEFPNTATYRVSTTDGQQRILSIGVDPGNVDDSNLYNEIINTNPDIVVTNNYFSIRVYGGKANTIVNYSGPNVNGTRYLNANGYAIVANNRITSNGTYTYVFDFVGTGHRRTITKAIFS
jgi:hypothetical protein